MMSHVTERDLEFLVVVGAGEPDPLHALIDRHRFYPLRCETERSTIYAKPGPEGNPAVSPETSPCDGERHVASQGLGCASG